MPCQIRLVHPSISDAKNLALLACFMLIYTYRKQKLPPRSIFTRCQKLLSLPSRGGLLMKQVFWERVLLAMGYDGG
jgi:hypothetical protein